MRVRVKQFKCFSLETLLYCLSWVWWLNTFLLFYIFLLLIMASFSKYCRQTPYFIILDLWKYTRKRWTKIVNVGSDDGNCLGTAIGLCRGDHVNKSFLRDRSVTNFKFLQSLLPLQPAVALNLFYQTTH